LFNDFPNGVGFGHILGALWGLGGGGRPPPPLGTPLIGCKVLTSKKGWMWQTSPSG